MYGLTPLDDNLPDAVEFTRQREKEIRQAMNQPERETVDSVDKIIRDRGKRYGDFSDNASVAQELKFVTHNSSNWDLLSDVQKEALDMIAAKISRILNGDPNYKDSWQDISGYASLVVKDLA